MVKNVKNFGLLIMSLMLVMSCASEQKRMVSADNNLSMLKGWMSGSFSSQQQAENDSDFYDIRLEMVPIWPERTDGVWLYVEQAAATHLDKPYRQRVYHVTQLDDTLFKSEVFSFNDPIRFAGDWEMKQPLESLTPDSLTERVGCYIMLKMYGDTLFEGSTEGNNCQSSLRGAAYVTSKVSISKERIYSWDRGFDAEGHQVWGAEKSGYIFERVKN